MIKIKTRGRSTLIENESKTQAARLWGVDQEENPNFVAFAGGNNRLECDCDLNKLVIDCGANSVKLGFAAPGLINPSRIIPNYVAKGKSSKFVGEEIEECKIFSGLKFQRPLDKGYLLNWDLELQILNLSKTYSNFGKHYDPSSIDLLLTEPLFNPESLRRNMYETLYEEEGFSSLFNCCPQLGALYDFQTNQTSEFSKYPAGIVVDCGYSFTHIVPFWDFTKLTYAIKRINVGGKLLTNHLKDIVSFRQWNMMDETYLTNHVKERLCYVSRDFMKDLSICKWTGKRNTIARSYVLPDNVFSTLGYVKGYDQGPDPQQHMMGVDTDQILNMNSERLIPEILFRPSDIGINQAGIAETIVQSVKEICGDLHELFYGNIVLMGGSTLFPGFKERLYDELRPLVPEEYQIKISMSKDPICTAWRGAAKFAQQSNYHNYAVSREEYLEDGFILCKRRFDSM